VWRQERILTAEELRQARVVGPGDFLEEARPVHPAFGHQEMQVRVGIDPVAEGLNGKSSTHPCPQNNLCFHPWHRASFTQFVAIEPKRF